MCVYIYIYIYKYINKNYPSVNLKLILNLSCLNDRLTIVTYAFLFPIRIIIFLLLPLRLPSCMQLSLFPPSPSTNSIPVCG